MKLLLFVPLLFLTTFSFADAWDNLTKQQAETVLAELKINPYIFDYCDCCVADEAETGTAHMMKVKSAEIVTCSWNSDYYSVKLKVEYICGVIYRLDGTGVSQVTFPESVGNQSDFFMNYTWGFSVITKKASPYFDLVSYDVYGEDPQPCKGEFAYPNPKEVKKVSKDKGYAKWYKANRL